MPPPESATESPTAIPTLRQRRRAVATQEILSAAESHITEHGPAALSLRAVARSLGMTVQALYHYFPSRNDLVTALVTKTYDDLADAVQAAVDAAPYGATSGDAPPYGEPPYGTAVPRLVVATEGYRRWGITHPERFQLLYGTPLRDYQAPVDGPTTQANRRMSAIFERELFGDFTTAQLASADIRGLSPSFRAHLESLPRDALRDLPPPATALLLSAWGQMHGLVVLEVFGHTAFLGEHQAEVFRTVMLDMYEGIRARIPAPAPEADTATPPD
ncbi:TetR/AcrR family transcriptional regulator [Streptomyces armeniacus]|uniref:TetR/AcrR family transcriptional regulator n=1 Tax=Streptomyces armeniacus TaxID=83291 RepID=A0A345XWX3_9ACTN|nr:TetR/AcrR family transcriptional regulator [Streptomyces armeniacus]AXK36139.1 TetR/AcrR family transcriptional regulator [Streptomyces armeniacus]